MKVIVNVGKTPEGYSASIDLLPEWVLGRSGTFNSSVKLLNEVIRLIK